MGRKNKKLAKLQQAQLAREVLRNQEKPPSYTHLSSHEKRIEIAHACTLLLSNPELQHPKLAALLELTKDEDPYVQALTITSLASVFVDILPGYRIAPLTQSKGMHSSEVRALRMYEGLLLKYYEEYLQVLNKHSSVGSLLCVCRLLRAVPHFNHSEKLLQIAIKKTKLKPEAVTEALREIVTGKELELRYRAVREIHKHIKVNSYKEVPTELIEILGEMDLTIVEEEAPKLPKKRNKAEKLVEKELEESQAQLTQRERNKHNYKTLKEVLAVYFRILKYFPRSHLLKSVLRGLTKYTQLLNIEMISDLVKTLLELIKHNTVTGENYLQCVQSSIQILNTSQLALNIEERSFVHILYKALLSPPTSLSAQLIFVRALSWLLLYKKQYSYEIVCAFLKRILQMSFHCSESLMCALLCLVKKILGKYPRTLSLFEDDEEAEVYNGELEDPALSNASTSSVLKEIELLKTVDSSQARTMIKNLTNIRQVDTKKPEEYLNASNDYFEKASKSKLLHK